MNQGVDTFLEIVSDLRQSRRLDGGGAAQSRLALRAKVPPSCSKLNVHSSPRFPARTLGNTAISNPFRVLGHPPNSRPHSSRQTAELSTPFPTLPELSNFASPPAEPEGFLLD